MEKIFTEKHVVCRLTDLEQSSKMWRNIKDPPNFCISKVGNKSKFKGNFILGMNLQWIFVGKIWQVHLGIHNWNGQVPGGVKALAADKELDLDTKVGSAELRDGDGVITTGTWFLHLQCVFFPQRSEFLCRRFILLYKLYSTCYGKIM